MEERILKLMKALDISREEAIEVIKSDLEVDRMTKSSDINSDLTDAQKKASKVARQGDRKVVTEKPKREKKTDNAKREIMAELIALAEKLGTETNVLNEEREVEFMYDGRKFKLTLSAPRK